MKTGNNRIILSWGKSPQPLVPLGFLWCPIKWFLPPSGVKEAQHVSSSLRRGDRTDSQFPRCQPPSCRRPRVWVWWRVWTNCNNNNNNWYLPTKLHSPESGFREVLHPIELEVGNVGFWGEGKTGEPGQKPLGAEKRTNNQLYPLVAWRRPRKWEASAITTTPSLLP